MHLFLWYFKSAVKQQIKTIKPFLSTGTLMYWLKPVRQAKTSTSMRRPNTIAAHFKLQ